MSPKTRHELWSATCPWLWCLALALPGCTLTPKHLPSAVTRHWATEPTRMVMVLAPTQMEQNGVPVHQGMMCRVYFFHEKDPIPVLADGDVVITAYEQPAREDGDVGVADDSGENGAVAPTVAAARDLNRPPDGLYQIPASELPGHVRKDIVGDSYLFWLPFDPKGKTQVLVQGFLKTRSGEQLTSGVVSLELEPVGTGNQATGAKRRPSQREHLIRQLASAAGSERAFKEAEKGTAPGGSPPEAEKSQSK